MPYLSATTTATATMMDFFKRLFAPAPDPSPKNSQSLSPDQFFATPQVQDMARKHRRSTTAFQLRRTKTPLGTAVSKFGGIPNLDGFERYPCCDACQMPLNFVFQLYRRDVPQFYFPADTNLFQLFRCPNPDCIDGFSDAWDFRMYHYYTQDRGGVNAFAKPEINLPDFEPEVVECSLAFSQIVDYPIYEDYDARDLEALEATYGESLTELFLENFAPVSNTKIGGYPNFTQAPYYPVCSCSKPKEFLFQLSSEDADQAGDPAKDTWSAHGITIGDVGNIYYYKCSHCGPESIESYWDCF